MGVFWYINIAYIAVDVLQYRGDIATNDSDPYSRGVAVVGSACIYGVGLASRSEFNPKGPCAHIVYTLALK